MRLIFDCDIGLSYLLRFAKYNRRSVIRAPRRRASLIVPTIAARVVDVLRIGSRLFD